MIDKTVFSSRFDLANNSLLRLIKHILMHRYSPMGNLFGNPGGRCLLVLLFLHYFSTPYFWMITRWERPLRFIAARLGKLR